jgi:hypothetical protein
MSMVGSGGGDSGGVVRVRDDDIASTLKKNALIESNWWVILLRTAEPHEDYLDPLVYKALYFSNSPGLC